MYFDGPQVQGGMPPMDPNAYAQRYATENGISLNEAKNQLRAKFGDPAKPNSTFAPEPNNMPKGAIGPVFNYQVDGGAFTYNPADLEGATPMQLAGFVRYGMQETGLSEKEFAQMIGLPNKEQPDDNLAKQKLKELGIPDSVIQKGDKAIRKYAEQNGIELPPKERK